MAKALRFCMITTFYPPYSFGGDGIFVFSLANALAKKGHHVEIIHCVDAHSVLSRDVQKTPPDHPSIKVHRLKSTFGWLSPLATHQTGYPLFKSKKIRDILANGFDVIHYHNISLVGGPKILEYGQGIKLYTIHECWLVCPTHILFRFNRKPCGAPICFFCNLIHKRPPQWWRYSGLLKNAVKNVDSFIAPSKFAGDIHLEKGLNIPITHIPNFISTDILPDSSKAQQTEDSPYFLFVGRLEKLKGLHTIIPLFLKNRSAKLLIAGTGTDESYFRGLAGTSNNISFLGHVSGKELLALYSNAVALIVPSICYETFSLVILEAFACKTPVIVRDRGGARELVLESKGGFLFKDEYDLADAVETLLHDSALRNKLGNEGYLAFQDKWTVDAHLEKYFSLINTKLSK